MYIPGICLNAIKTRRHIQFTVVVSSLGTIPSIFNHVQSNLFTCTQRQSLTYKHVHICDICIISTYEMSVLMPQNHGKATSFMKHFLTSKIPSLPSGMKWWVSWVIGVPAVTIHLSGIFPNNKPSIFLDTPMTMEIPWKIISNHY